MNWRRGVHVQLQQASPLSGRMHALYLALDVDRLTLLGLDGTGCPISGHRLAVSAADVDALIEGLLSLKAG
jgi:hypothetical protein